MKHFKQYQSLQSFANAYARKNHYGKATQIIPGENLKIHSFTRYGYRKITTGEYVANAYRIKFGWKNTFYQRSECVVQVPKEVIEYFHRLELCNAMHIPVTTEMKNHLFN